MGIDRDDSFKKWRLKDLAEIRTGGTPRRDVREYWGGTIPWMSSGEVNARYIGAVKERITDAGFNASNAQRLSPGTTMMALAGQGSTRGKVALLKIETTCNQSLVGITPGEAIDEHFLFFQLDSMYDEIRAINGDQVRAGLNLELVGNIEVKVPPLAEQKKIAQILSSVDEAIQATQAVIDQTRRVKEAMLQTLLTRGLGHTRFQQTEIGEIPEGWAIRRCEDLTHQISVGIVVRPTQYYVPHGVKCWRSANIGEGFVRDSEWVYISEESNELMRKSRLSAGDVVVVRTGFPGTACVVPPELDNTNCIDILFVKPKADTIIPAFLAWFINSSVGKSQVLKMQGGLAQKHLNAGELHKMLVPLPPLREQTAIVEHIQELLATVQNNAHTADALQLVKSALLQTLLSGQTRVTP